MGYDAFYPLPKAAFASDGVLAEGFGDAPIGNGPFRMKGTWQHDEQIQSWRRSPTSRARSPRSTASPGRSTRTSATQYADLTAGNLDVETKIPIESLASAIGDLGPRLQKSPSSVFSFVGFPSLREGLPEHPTSGGRSRWRSTARR